MKRLLMIPAVLLALGASVASANDVVVGPIYTPLVAPPPVAETVYYGAPPPAVAQTTYYAPAAVVPQTTYYAPAPATVAPAPVYTYRPTIVRGPVVAYSPVAPTVTYSPVAPVVAYSPVVAAPAYGVAGPVMVPAGRPVTVSTKVYVPGQPVRNFFKAVTP
jgi:hypothetical protein